MRGCFVPFAALWASASDAPRKDNSVSLRALPLKGEAISKEEGGAIIRDCFASLAMTRASPLLNTLIMGCSLVRVTKAEFCSFPEKERDTRGESKRGEASLI